MITMNNILNSPTTLSEVIDNKIKIFANDIDNSDNFNPNQVDVLLRTSYLLTKLSSINAELQSVENEIINIHKSEYTKENGVFNKILKEEINTLNWTPKNQKFLESTNTQSAGTPELFSFLDFFSQQVQCERDTTIPL